MRIEPEWQGQPAFIIAGGPSVSEQNIELLRGRRVIAINSSFPIVPWADLLFFGDLIWWRNNRAAVLDKFKGRIVSICEMRDTEVVHVRRRKPPGLAIEPDELTMKRTSLSGATNLAFHLGASSIVWLGADGKMSGNRSHHHAPHQNWKHNPDRWPQHYEELKTIVEPLKGRGIPVINASPGTAWDLAPVMTLEQAIQQVEHRRAA